MPCFSRQTQKILLASQGKANCSVISSSRATLTQQFAASELARYLQQISGADFPVLPAPDRKTGAAILVEIDPRQEQEAYSIKAKGRQIVLTGGSGRAVLYAVYDFLHRLGCVWAAPEFSFYEGLSEYVPHRAELFYDAGQTIEEHPRLKFRKLDVEEGRSHNTENLKQIIDWMPKLRFNILMVPLNYGGWGKVQWDRWREALIPELKKRGLMIEVGGHGYQNFLNAGMEDSTLFKKHPDWFGKNKNCEPTPDEYDVFNTSNPEAVQYLIRNVQQYIRLHPEIDIFDFWPPDMARWAECPELLSLGSPLDRQAALVNAVDSAIKKINPGIILEMIAYQPVLLPPEKELNRDVLVDFCPINQSFEKQIFDPASSNNAAYVDALLKWRKKFAGNIGLYSYYRKYGWRSLPNIIPHYMQQDMKWYAQVPVQGISTYAEPGDWFTYELNHYVLGHLAWDPDAAVDSLVNGFCRARYGTGWELARQVYTTLESTVRIEGNIPYTALKPAQQTAETLKELTTLRETMASFQAPSSLQQNFSRLLLMLDYAIYDLQIQEARGGSSAAAEEKTEQLVRFLEANRHQGVFILPGKNVLENFKKRYRLLK